MIRHQPYTHPGPSLTTGPDNPRPPCADRFDVYDALVDTNHRHGADDANVEAARMMCATCVLRMPDVADKCIRGAIERAETWVSVVLDRDVRKPPTARETCGKPHGLDAHSKNRERPCAPCRKASARRVAERKRAKREADAAPSEKPELEGVVVRNVTAPSKGAAA